jgi:hypothetical protein
LRSVKRRSLGLPLSARSLLESIACAADLFNRDRGEPRDSTPPTPPYVRVRIRRFRDGSPRGPDFRLAFRQRKASPLPGSFRASPYPPLNSSAEADWLAHGLRESRALLITITVRAFIRFRTNMPSADFCCRIKAPCDAFSHEFATRNRSPEVSSTAFRTQPPNLQPVPLMDMRFAINCSLARHRMPPIRFLYIGSYVCSTLPSDPPSPERPCASL